MSFTLKMNPNHLFIYSMEVNIYMEFWTLEMKCTQYGICEEMAFKNARRVVFSRSGGAGRSFRSDPENPDGQPPLPVCTSPEN